MIITDKSEQMISSLDEARCPTVYATIVSSNEELASACLESLLRYGPDGSYNLRINLVWNAQSRGGPALPPTLSIRYPQVNMIENPVSGFEVNQNLLISRSRASDYVLILNDDLIFLPSSVRNAVKFMEIPDNARVGVLGIRLLNPDGTLQHSTYSFPGLFRAILSISELRQLVPLGAWLFPVARLVGLGAGKSRYWSHDQTCEVDTFRGSYMLARGRAVEEVGLLDEDGGQETEWQYRFHKRGWKVVFYPGAEVIHLGSRTVSKDPLRRVIYLKIMLSFFGRHKQGWRFFLLLIFCYVFFSVLYLISTILRDVKQRDVAVRSLRLLHFTRVGTRAMSSNKLGPNA